MKCMRNAEVAYSCSVRRACSYTPGKLLAVDVKEGTLREVERVDRSVSDSQTGGWSNETIGQLMERLWEEGGVQWMTICSGCAKGGGFVSRADVYSLGEYDEARTLRGFTRPANRLAQEFREAGIVPPTAIDILQAVYDSSISYVQASGFRVPEGLIPLVQDYMSTREIKPEDYQPEPHSAATTGVAARVPSVPKVAF